MKALVGAFNQEKALVGAFSVIAQPVVEPMDQFAVLKETDFLALELVEGHVHLVLSTGGRRVELKDNHPSGVDNNQWHELAVTRKWIIVKPL